MTNERFPAKNAIFHPPTYGGKNFIIQTDFKEVELRVFAQLSGLDVYISQGGELRVALQRSGKFVTESRPATHDDIQNIYG